MAKIQRYGIKFPMTIESDDNTLLDLNQSRGDKIKSEIMHLIFTPKGQRLRQPTFGTNLIQFIFNPNDTQTFDDVVNEIKMCVGNWIPDCNIKDVQIAESESGLDLFAKIVYTVAENDGSVGTYEIISKL